MESTAASPLATANEDDAHEDGHVHVVPMWILVSVWVTLMILTVVTVAASWIDLGVFNIWLAMLIATVKAGVVGLFFMHLIWDRPFHSFILIASLFFVFILIGIAMMDSFQYEPNVELYRESTEIVAP